MGYEITFTPNVEKDKIKSEDYVRYFSQRPNYIITGSQFDYKNNATNAYFTFYIEDNSNVGFFINYFRPHYFLLEAIIEIQEFLTNFPCIMNDTQLEERGPFNTNKFIQKWKEGNKNTCKIAEINSNFKNYKQVPTTLLTKFWEWNFDIEQLLNSTFFDLDIFVPELMFYEEDGGDIKLLSLWPKAMPIVLPAGIDVMLGRESTSSENLELTIKEWSDMQDVINKYKDNRSNEDYVVIDYSSPPDEIESLFQFGSSKLINRKCIIDPDFIINTEYFDKND